MDLPKDFNQLLKGLFGFPRYSPSQDWRPASDFNNESDDDQEDHEDYEDHDPRDRQDFPNRDGFNFHFSVVMRSFTQGLLEEFGIGGAPGFGGILDLEDHSDNPDHFTKKPPRNSDDDEHLDSRSFMLKDDDIAPREPTVDTDLDDEDVSIGDLSKLFSNKEQNKVDQLKPFDQSPWTGIDGRPGEGRKSFFRSFSSSQSQQTIRIRIRVDEQTIRIRIRADGSIEHIETTKRGADGTEVKTDEFVNMDVSGLEDFNSRWDGTKSKQSRSTDDRIQRYSPRNEMISPPADKLYGSLFDKFFGR